MVRYLEVASPGRRLLALLIDGLIILWLQILAHNLGLSVVLTSPWGLPITGSYPLWVARYMLFLLIAQIPHFVYFLVLESATNGFTLGKKLAGIRVVEGAQPASPRACAVRNILRVVDHMPFSYGVGILSVLVDKKNRRVGDLGAGTVVIRWPIRERLQLVPTLETVYPGSTKVPQKSTGSEATGGSVQFVGLGNKPDQC